MAKVIPVITHVDITGAPADLTALVDGPKWDKNHAVAGLDNLDDTADADKPVSTAQAAALALKASLAGNNAFTGNIAIGGAAPSTAALLVSNYTASAVYAPDSPTVLHVTNPVAGTTARVLLDGYGAHTVLSFRYFGGTAAAPTAVPANKQIGALSAWGYGSTTINSGSAAGRATLIFNSAETWTDTAQGTFTTLETTPIGSATRAERLRIADTGFIGVGTSVPDALLTLSAATAGLTGATVTPTSGTLLHLVGVDGTAARSWIDSFGSGGNLTFRRANNTLASPSGMTAGTNIGTISAQGYHNGSAYSAASRAVMIFQATETWTSSAQGAALLFQTTPNGSTTTATAMTLQPSGGVSIGTAADPLIGGLGLSGALNAATINGAVIDNLGWSTYTPTVTNGSGTLTTATITGRYKQIGKTVRLQLRMNVSNAGSAAIYTVFALPSGLPVNATGSIYPGVGLNLTTNSPLTAYAGASAAGVVLLGTPVANDYYVSVTYETT